MKYNKNRFKKLNDADVKNDNVGGVINVSHLNSGFGDEF